MPLKISSFKVRGLANKTKREKIFTWIKDQSISIALLQETHSSSKTDSVWSKQWGAKVYFSGKDSKSKGIAILINDNFNCKIINYEEIIQGRLQSLELEINEHTVTIINIYGPNTDDVSLFNKLDEYLGSNDEKTFIIGGDFNTILDVELDKKHGNKNTHPNVRKKILSIIDENSLKDIWRIQHPEKQQYTWQSNTKLVIFSRLDYFLLSENITNYIIKTQIKPGYNSDHSLVSIEIDFVKLDRGPGVFKMNNSVLLEHEYQNQIRQDIETIGTLNKDSNPNTLWELIKGSIRNVTIKYTCAKKKKENEKEKQLQNEILNIEKKLSETNDHQEIENTKQNLKKAKSELNNITDNKINGILIRSKANKIEYNEKNSKYFASLEKKKADSKIITNLNVDGKQITNQSEIRKAQKNYYENLYDRKNTQNPSINFFNDTMNKLDDEAKLSI